jgi:hypothetical protein
MNANLRRKLYEKQQQKNLRETKENKKQNKQTKHFSSFYPQQHRRQRNSRIIPLSINIIVNRSNHSAKSATHAIMTHENRKQPNGIKTG